MAGSVALSAPAAGSCRHCGLAAPAGEAFCCFGCELAGEIAADGGQDHARLYGRFAFALVLTMVVMMLALFLYPEDVYGAAADRELAWLREIYRALSAVLTTGVVALTAPPLVRRAGRRLLVGRWSTEALVLLGALAAYGVSLRNIWGAERGVYFESTATALSLATLGRYLTATARSRASRLLGPTLARARGLADVVDEPGGVRTIAAAAIFPGMMLRVAPEAVVPVDLELTTDRAEIDLAVLTGESRPLLKTRGEVVPAGAVALGDGLRGRALRSARHSTLEQLARLAQGFRDRAPRLVHFADRLAAMLAPAITGLAAAAGIVWGVRDGLDAGVQTGLAVALVACPCTYAVATPLVYWLALRRGLTRGVLIRNPDVLEAMARVRTVAFDKTGTLTGRQPTVIAHEPATLSKEILGLVRALEAPSQHPVGRALHALASPAPAAALHARHLVPGAGVAALDARGRQLTLGPRVSKELASASPSPLAAESDRSPTAFEIALQRDGAVLARFWLSEAIRADAAATISALRSDGLDVVILSGDRRPYATPVADALCVPVRAELLPSDKATQLENLGPDTAMVGDGLNDAPALASAGVGFALAAGADLARGLAAVTLVADDLTLVPWSLSLARRSVRLARRLLVSSTVYNVAFVVLAALGLLRPVFAGLSMLVASLVTLGVASTIDDAGGEAPC